MVATVLGGNKNKKSKTISDPLYGSIEVSEEALRIIDTKEFQRLRHIKQLGTVYLVYPGANHTRFEHSLGAYYLALEITKKLEIENYKEELTMAALLHDVGHGPFSHLLEEVPGIPWRHEKESINIIKKSKISDILNDEGIDVSRVCEYILGKGNLGAFISGDLDVDRMDYILRDSHYTGIGVTYDFHRIVNTMKVMGSNIVIEEKGIIAVEGFLIARHVMYSRVYLHHTTRSSEGMLKKAILHLIKEGYVTVEDLVGYDDIHFWKILREGTKFSKFIAERLFTRNLYKRAIELKWKEVPKELRDEILSSRNAIANIEKEISEEAGVEEEYIIVDASPLHTGKKNGVKILLKDGTIVSFEDVSRLVSSLKEAQLDHWRFWIFTPKEMVDNVGRAARRVLGLC